jgi:hypothetical protein
MRLPSCFWGAFEFRVQCGIGVESALGWDLFD